MSFRHELARAAVLDILAAQRRVLQREILDTLVASAGDPADIVHHAEAAGAIDVVADYALRAARQAAALAANREALRHYQRAARGRAPRRRAADQLTPRARERVLGR